MAIRAIRVFFISLGAFIFFFAHHRPLLTVPEEVLKEVRNCIRRGNVHKHTIDHDQPVRDNINVRAELLLEAAAQQVETLECTGEYGGSKTLDDPLAHRGY
jgi:hypothetical protein